MRWMGWIAAAFLTLAAGAGNAQAPPVKLALVIGNSDYDGDGRIDVSDAGVQKSEAGGYVPDLRNPLNDASDIRDALERIGFRVDFVKDADGAGMSTALAAFGARVAEAPEDAQVVIYYAGHAIQLDGANFLIPVKAQLPAADFSRMPSVQAQTILGRVAVSTGEVLDQFREPRSPGVNLLILDSCRNNPWERRMRGLSRGPSQTRGMADLRANISRTIVAFSTQPGDVAQDGAGRNSPFSAVLKDQIGSSGTVLQMLDRVGGSVQHVTGGRQTPWFQTPSIGEACLARCDGNVVVAPPPAPLHSVRDLVGVWENARPAGAIVTTGCNKFVEIASIDGPLRFRMYEVSPPPFYQTKKILSRDAASLTVEWAVAGPAVFAVDPATGAMTLRAPFKGCNYARRTRS